jgi:putative cell wall-binding protein
MTLKAWSAPIAAVLVGGVVLALVAALAPAAPAQEPPEDCPDPQPLDEVGEGDTGTGYTVVTGTEPVPFDAEVVRVVEDWAGPDRDIIVAEVSGEALDEADTDGPWAGMSGAPVYADDGELLGSVAWQVSDSAVGLTPGEDVVELLESETATAQAGTARQTATSGDMSREDRRAVAQHTGSSPSGVEAERLPTPLLVAGMGDAQIEALRDGVAGHGLSLAVQPAQTRAADGEIEPADVEDLGPGTNFAPRAAAGDVSLFVMGTTTVVCDGRAAAMGHPVSFDGEVDAGASLAETFAISDHPRFGPVANALLGAPVGRVDQDRSAGLRTLLGEAPSETEITSEVADAASGDSRSGETRVAVDEVLPFVANSHVSSNVEAVQDRIGEGTALAEITVRGTTADGEEWEIARENRYASRGAISFSAGHELSSILGRLLNNEFAAVTVDDVDVQLEADTAYRDLRLETIVASVGGETIELDPDEPEPVEVEPGEHIELTARLRPWQQEDEREEVSLTLDVPADYEGPAMLRVGAGDLRPGPLPFERHVRLVLDALQPVGLDPHPIGPPTPDVESFDDLVAHLEEQPRNDELTAELVSEPVGPNPAPDEPHHEEERAEEIEARSAPAESVDREEPEVLAEDRELLGDVVRGHYRGPAFVGERHEPVEAAQIERLAGPDRIATAAAISADAHPDPGAVDTVVLARADEFADALAGGPLAAHLGGPLLLSGGDALPEATAAEIARLDPQRAVILGGSAAISDDVAVELDGLVGEVDRVAGNDRFATAAAVAERLPAPTAYVALGAHPTPGRAWPDAISAGGAAAADGGAVLLTAPGELPQATADALDTADEAVIVGGDAAVPAQVEAAVAERVARVERVAGQTRYDTSARLVERLVRSGLEPESAWLATGRDYPDALAAGPAAAADGGALLLVDGQRPIEGSPETGRALHELAPMITRVVLVGGPEAVTEEVAAAAESVTGRQPAPEHEPAGEEPREEPPKDEVVEERDSEPADG